MSSFAKAKIHRFNEETTCAPPPGRYDPKLDTKIKGAVLPVSKRFPHQKCSSSSLDSIEGPVNPSHATFRTNLGSVASERHPPPSTFLKMPVKVSVCLSVACGTLFYAFLALRRHFYEGFVNAMNDDEGARIRQLLDETLSEDDIVHENSEDEEDQLEIDVFEDTDDTDADPNFEVDEQSDVSDDDEDDDFSHRRQRKRQRLDYNILPCTSTPRTVTQLASTPRPASAPAATPQAFTPPAATPRAVI
ncbi:hypothetical protein J6590_018272 [Homalodisca vitripennis]|nr:hypothetical protein J6590_018272 [Homalodisca vitripennis]